MRVPLMLDAIAGEIVEKVMDELDGRSVFNGIDDDIMDEIRESLYDIVVKEIL
jgi:N-acetylglucosamine kinase-like BadF-type ATPase